MALAPADPLTLALIVAALAFGSFAKGVTGIGLPIVAIPLLANFLGVEHAVVVMVIPTLLSNLWLIWIHRDQMPLVRRLSGFLIFGTVGGIGGTWLLAAAGQRSLTLLLAACLGAYLLLLLRNPNFRLPYARPLAPALGFAAGAVQGATGISAPVIAPYLSGIGLTKDSFVFAITLAFTLFSFSQIGAMIHYDLFTTGRLIESLVALIPVAIFVPAGARWARRLSPQAFRNLLLGMFFLLELRLLYEGIWGG